jgi:[ribosomal protein S18]-alanine N-acetyltransferase
MENEGVRLRAMLLADVAMVMEVEVRSFPTPWSEYAFYSELQSNSNAFYYVAETAGKVIGYGGMWIIIDEAHITNIAVHPDYRGRKIGEALLCRLIAEAADRGAGDMTLEVRKNNIVAQNLYKKYNFTPRGIRRGYYSDTGEDAIIMWRYGHVSS